MTQRGAASEAQLLTTQSSAGDVSCGGDHTGPAKGAWGQQGLGKWDLTATLTARAGAATASQASPGAQINLGCGFSRGVSPDAAPLGTVPELGQGAAAWDPHANTSVLALWGEKSLLGGKCGLWWAELRWSGKKASAVKVLDQMKRHVLAWQTLALPFPSRPQGCSLTGRRALLLCPL